MSVRLVAVVITCSLVTLPRPALAQPAAPAAEEPDALAEAKAKHAEADAKYNTADYEGAIKAWTEAFRALPRTPESNTYRPLIMYNIAAAHEKLFDLDSDVFHLKQAKVLLERFEASIPEIYADAPEEGETERTQVKEKLAKIDARIAEASAAPPPKTEPKAEPEAKPGPDQPPPRASKPGRALVIGGGVTLGLGVGALAGMGAALGIANGQNDISDISPDDYDARGEQFDKGRAADKGAIAAGVIGGVLIGAGIALLVVGLKRRNARTAVAPAIGPRMTGLSIVGRF